MNDEFNLLHHVGVVVKKVRAAAAHEGDDNTPSDPTGRGKKPRSLRGPPFNLRGGGLEFLSRTNSLFQPGSAAR